MGIAYYFVDLARAEEMNCYRGVAAVDADIAELEALLQRFFPDCSTRRSRTHWLLSHGGAPRPEALQQLLAVFPKMEEFQVRAQVTVCDEPTMFYRKGSYQRALRLSYAHLEQPLQREDLELAWGRVIALPVNEVHPLPDSAWRREPWNSVKLDLELRCPRCGGEEFTWLDSASDASTGDCCQCGAWVDFRWGAGTLPGRVVRFGAGAPLPLPLQRYSDVVVLTGAGISAASGLPTYNQLQRWERQQFQEDPLQVWQHLAAFRANILQARPNSAHLSLARAEADSTDNWTLITQNVDELHRAAGSRNIIELHGSLLRTRCTVCSAPGVRDERLVFSEVPCCPSCGEAQRPDIVFMGEPLDGEVEYRVKSALRHCDLFLAVGTSGRVLPASQFVSYADFAGAKTVLVDPSAGASSNFMWRYQGLAEELLPRLL